MKAGNTAWHRDRKAGYTGKCGISPTDRIEISEIIGHQPIFRWASRAFSLSRSIEMNVVSTCLWPRIIRAVSASYSFSTQVARYIP
ncbi:MAG TPA: hypothetical protein DEB39_11195 [Planctomycetaceae bacterium]|nr:hypothetical protein [Planctomycetaceae bacterium]